MNHSPDKLVVGTKLIVPKNTFLSEHALKRLNRYKNMKNTALAYIRRAKTYTNRTSKNKSEIYKQALNLLKKAKEAEEDLIYDSGNYIEAERLAREAIKFFKIDKELYTASSEMEELKERVEKEMNTANRLVGKLYQQKRTFLKLVTVMLLSVLLLISQKRRKERVIRIQGWLDKHIGRVERFEKVEI